uniref:FAD/NAD(P)-binding domain-containing protein n=1 Tax=Mycena chlorophos TaxID=658473 RepID=A0ABQ0KVI4_MYCCL|nr:FAD/NAD(P)-binding domain-containing protein [Mycena chlorophos]
MSTEKTLRVAICGGGISGLCLAVALSQHEHIKVDVWESAERFKELGAGLMVFARTWRIFQLLGLEANFSAATHTKPDPSVGYQFRRSDLGEEGFGWHFVPFPYGCRTFHRAHFLDVFVDGLPPNIVHYGKRLSSYKQDETTAEIILNFTDGSCATCDLLVGCDGIKSTVRKQMFSTMAQREAKPEFLNFVDPKWTGTIAYRGLVPATRLVGPGGERHRTLDSPVMYCGKNQHLVAYAISRGEMVNVVAYLTDPSKENTVPDSFDWVADCDREEVLQTFSSWESEAQVLLNNMQNPTKWNIHKISPLPNAVDGRVVLLGDALHAMGPHLGAGATTAIEDAFILAILLGATSSPDTLDLALAAYEEIRLAQANHIQHLSDEAGHMFELNSSYRERLDDLGPAIARQWSFLADTTPDDEAKRALDYRFRLLNSSDLAWS